MLAGAQEVSAPAQRRHHHPEVHQGIPGSLVSAPPTSLENSHSNIACLLLRWERNESKGGPNACLAVLATCVISLPIQHEYVANKVLINKQINNTSPLTSSLSLSLAKFMRRTQAATIIQKYRRMYVEKKRYRQKQAAALAMQTILRGYIARQKYQAVRRTSRREGFS